MSDDTKNMQTVYNAKEVASVLAIKESTLRKYALMLEKAGYSFHYNDKRQRGYFDHDVMAFRRLMDTAKANDMTLERAANAVVTSFDTSVTTHGDTIEREEYKRDMDEIKAIIQKQNELLHKLTNHLDQQQEITNNRDKQILEALHEIQEAKLLAAPTEEKEEEEEPEEEKPLSFWARLFGK